MSKLIKTAYNPDFVSPPAETVLETLEMLGLSQEELAERTGKFERIISETVREESPITSEIAMQLELVLGVPATFWLARELQYQAFIARQEG